MVERIKARFWHLLKSKDVSLLMLFNQEGEIIWSKGRDIVGKTIDEGEGFSKTFIRRVIETHQGIEKDNVLITSDEQKVTQSAYILHLKSVMIIPCGTDYYLYLDSGIRRYFSDSDKEAIRFACEVLADGINQIRNSENDVGGFTGTSEKAKQVRELILKYSLSNRPILLLGEIGCGKNRVAELIHRFAGKGGKLVIFNTAMIPVNVHESELFGQIRPNGGESKYEKRGLIAEAESGTLLINEIADLSQALQKNFYDFITKGRYLPLGGAQELPGDVRLIFASMHDLQKLVKDNLVIPDLASCLQHNILVIPSLRQRREDIKYLVVEKQELLKGKIFGPGFWETVHSYNWPGNIQELETVLFLAGLGTANPILGRDVEKLLKNPPTDELVAQPPRQELSLPVQPEPEIKKSMAEKPQPQGLGDSSETCDAVERVWEEFKKGKDFWDAVRRPLLDRNLKRGEVKQLIEKALEKSGGKYKNVLPLFNLKTVEYKKFLNFLTVHKIMDESSYK